MFDTPLFFLVFVLVFGVLVFVHELGHFVTAKLAGVKVEEFGFGFPPRLLAFRRGETEYSLNAIPIGGFVRMLGEDNPREERSFASAPKRWRAVILLAGATMNLLAGVLLFAGGYMSGMPTAVESEVVVRSVVADSPAEQAGVRADDVILRLGAKEIENTTQLREETQKVLGQPTTLVVRREGAEVPLKITPYPDYRPDRGALGVSITDWPTKTEPVKYPLDQALANGARDVARLVQLTAGLPGMLVRGLVPAEAARPVGPVGIYQLTSQATEETVRTGMLFPIFLVAALLSVGLGIANVLPIPGLDGGRLLFVVIEAVRGRRISPEREGAIHFAGIAALLAISLLIAYFDVIRPVPDIDWGIR